METTETENVKTLGKYINLKHSFLKNDEAMVRLIKESNDNLKLLLNSEIRVNITNNLYKWKNSTRG